MGTTKNVWCHASRGRARADAADMILTYGSMATDVVRRLACAERRQRLVDVLLPPGHWQRVEREVARQLARQARQAGRAREA